MTIKDFKDFGVVDFIEEDHFRKWVLSKDHSMDFFWHAYLKEYPNQSGNIEEARQIILETHHFFRKESESIAFPKDDFKERLKETFRESKKEIPLKSSSRNFKIYKLAAAACMLFVVAAAWYFIQFNTQDKVEYFTGNGEWKEVILPDGSKAELNANTQLSITKEWKPGEDRKVWLKGEAFFKVTKKPSTNAKFTVVTKDLEVEVLGTSFNVNTRNQHTEVFLEEGKITLNLDEQKEQIEPGEFISYSQEKKQIIKRYKKTEEIHSNWKDGILKIDDATIKIILNEIESIYGIDLIVKNEKLLDKEGAVAIPVDDLEMTTLILERVLNVKIKRKGKQYFIN